MSRARQDVVALAAVPAVVLAVVLAVVFSFFGAVSTARATDRYFSDAKVLSENRAFKLEATSPDNASGPAPFASRFTYALFDQRAKKLIWSRAQGSEEGSPLSVAVSDEGNVAARLSSETVIFLDPKDGSVTTGPNLLEAIPPDESSRFVSVTTAGPMWTGRSRMSFITIPTANGSGTETYFVVRTFWGRHIVIDVSTGRAVDLGAGGATSSEVPDDPRAATIFAAVLREEARWAIARLTYAAKVDPLVILEKGDYRTWHDLFSAIHVVGCRELRDAVPTLRKLEQATNTSTLREGAGELRSELHLALRRLGEMPAVGPCAALVPYVKCESGGWIPDHAHAITKPVAFADRARNAEKVREGISIVELGALIGGPDAQFYDADLRAHCLDWDLDGATPSTLRIALDLDTNNVKAVVRITPAVWRAGYERELGRRALPPK